MGVPAGGFHLHIQTGQLPQAGDQGAFGEVPGPPAGLEDDIGIFVRQIARLALFLPAGSQCLDLRHNSGLKLPIIHPRPPGRQAATVDEDPGMEEKTDLPDQHSQHDQGLHALAIEAEDSPSGNTTSN